MIEAALCIGAVWLVWKLAMHSLDRAERDCEIARLLASTKKPGKAIDTHSTPNGQERK